MPATLISPRGHAREGQRAKKLTHTHRPRVPVARGYARVPANLAHARER